MKGHIRQRAEGSWTLYLPVGKYPNGRTKYDTRTIHGKRKDAERELARWITEVESGGYVDETKMTVAQYLESWLLRVKPNVAGKTFERYAEIVHSHLIPALGRYNLQRLTPLQVQDYYAQASERGRKDGKGGLAPQTVVHHHRVLREALNDAVQLGVLGRNPADRVKPPKVDRKEQRVLNKAEIEAVLKSAEGTVFYVPVVLAVTTGMRRGEILALRWEDVDFDAKVVHVRRSLEETKAGVSFKEPKTSKSRRAVNVPDMVLEVLAKHRDEQAEHRKLLGKDYWDEGLICARPDGKPIVPKYISSNFYVVLERAGLPRIPFHNLRHTHATALFRQGAHPKVVQERLGHSTIVTTMDVYSHVLPSMQEQAARMIGDFLAPSEGHAN